jgi:ubiquinone/menaquinone biosynthesis C-methylase UbiE
MQEMKFKRALIAHAKLAAGQRVLDLGAGTLTQAIMVKQIQPDEQVTGLDGDPAILSIAREKASCSNVKIVFDVGNVVALPYTDQSFEGVTSTLVMSVRRSAEKRLAIREARQVLVRGGRTICDCL